MRKPGTILAPVILAIVIAGILAPVWWGGGFPATEETVLSNVPLAQYQWKALRGEESLFWCHYGGCGYPIHAASQGGFFHPLNFITALFPAGMVYPIRWVLALVLGGLAMYAFLRGKMVSEWGAFIGAVGYALGGFWIARLDMMSVVIAAPILPLGWLAVEWMVDGKWSRGIALGMCAIGWGFLAGSTQLTLIAILGIILYGIGRALDTRSLVSALIGLVLISCIGIGIAGVQIIPSLELLTRSGNLLEGFQPEGYSLFPIQLVGMIFPRIFGFQRTVTFDTGQEWSQGSYWGSGVFWEACPYVGAVVLMFAIVAVARRHPGAVWLGIIAVIGAVLAFGEYTPVWEGIRHLPVLSEFRIPARFFLLTAGAIAALGGMGVDALANSVKRRWIWGVAIVIVGVGMAATLSAAVTKIPDPKHTAEWMGLTGERLLQTLKFAPQTLSPWSTDQAVPILALLLLGITIILRFPRILIAAIVVVEMGFFGYRSLSPAIKYDRMFSPAPPTAHLPDGRMYSDPKYRSGGDWDRLKAIPANVNWMFDIPRPDALGSLFDDRRMHYDQAMKDEFQLGGHRLLSIAGVSTIVSRRTLSMDNAQLVAGGEVLFYSVANSVPLAYFPKRIHSLAQGEEPIATLLNPNFGIGNSVLLEGWKGVFVTGSSNEVHIKQWRHGQIEMDSDGGGGILRIGESYDPGWRATVDGQPAELLRADYLFMALHVPSGKHQVALSYIPPRFWVGAGLSIICVILMAGFWISSFLTDRIYSDI
jgi:hypothetical protein